MDQFDTTDILLIAIALVAFGGHFIYSQYKKIRERSEEHRQQSEQPQVWGKIEDDSDKR
ncbi:hypothetical protein [Xenorhabdus sp. KJ12.1]|uniref:hypothetical protein n=1 Tax=Xenorhabdus sp. KJ12.1 TaxID=1851571 RepID=UPI000C06010A|nr:hypothetical protein [Xenorhabdus sp. KJ12.1]PHM72372.1 hypothetical protein Xekj_00651 [Xenorhabdus sp. KJ12.1]